MLIISLVVRPDGDDEAVDDEEDRVLLPPPLLLLDGEPDNAVCVAVTPPLLVADCEFDGPEFAPVGAVSATCPITIVEVAVAGPGLMVPAPLSWLQVSNIAAMSPLNRAKH